MVDPVSLHRLGQVIQEERIAHLLRVSHLSPSRRARADLRPALRLTGQWLVRAGMALQGLTAEPEAIAESTLRIAPTAGAFFVPVARWRPARTAHHTCQRRSLLDASARHRRS